jgi:hypothetical protein
MDADLDIIRNLGNGGSIVIGRAIIKKTQHTDSCGVTRDMFLVSLNGNNVYFGIAEMALESIFN